MTDIRKELHITNEEHYVRTLSLPPLLFLGLSQAAHQTQSANLVYGAGGVERSHERPRNNCHTVKRAPWERFWSQVRFRPSCSCSCLASRQHRFVSREGSQASHVRTPLHLSTAMCGLPQTGAGKVVQEAKAGRTRALPHHAVRPASLLGGCTPLYSVACVRGYGGIRKLPSSQVHPVEMGAT
jgi:hypothetical protein